MAYTITNLSLFIFLPYLNGLIFNSIPIIHLIVIFDHILIQIFLQFIAGLDRVVFFRFLVFDVRIFGQCGGTVKSPQLISSPPDNWFLVGL